MDREQFTTEEMLMRYRNLIEAAYLLQSAIKDTIPLGCLQFKLWRDSHPETVAGLLAVEKTITHYERTLYSLTNKAAKGTKP